jgi:histidinol phosphatase-like PHP family hydrolase
MFSIGTDAHNVGTTGNLCWAKKVVQGAGIGPENLIKEARA